MKPDTGFTFIIADIAFSLETVKASGNTTDSYILGYVSKSKSWPSKANVISAWQYLKVYSTECSPIRMQKSSLLLHLIVVTRNIQCVERKSKSKSTSIE